ncbi:hypothetical protein ONS96_007626 [Cadophora gregata f. sp. sojae]|nr:hypothetical protein ONS96_007626 [Cadophora gregata f. sp. sojae]
MTRHNTTSAETTTSLYLTLPLPIFINPRSQLVHRSKTPTLAPIAVSLFLSSSSLCTQTQTQGIRGIPSFGSLRFASLSSADAMRSGAAAAPAWSPRHATSFR